jgi:hypothetical protein
MKSVALFISVAPLGSLPNSKFEWEAYTLIRSVAQGEALADTIPRLIIDRMLHACGLVRISTSNNLE